MTESFYLTGGGRTARRAWRATQRRGAGEADMAVGRPKDERREVYRVRYGLTPRTVRRLSEEFMDRLDRCQSEEARRLLLGVAQ